MKRGKYSVLEGTLAAAGAILARGEPLTYGALARELGEPHRTVMRRVDRYRFKKVWPHKVCRRDRGPIPGQIQTESVAAIAAVGAIRGRGEPLTYRALAAELGIAEQAAASRLQRIRELNKLGACDVDVTTSRPVFDPVRARDAAECREPGPEAAAGVAARRAEMDSAKRGQAIDGRAEVDDPRVSAPPQSRWRPVPVAAPAQQCAAYLGEWKLIRRRA